MTSRFELSGVPLKCIAVFLEPDAAESCRDFASHRRDQLEREKISVGSASTHRGLNLCPI